MGGRPRTFFLVFHYILLPFIMKRKLLLFTLILAAASTRCLADHQVGAPAPCYPIPTPDQVEWQKMQTYAFIHFGLNTFNDREWGYGDSKLETFNPTKANVEQWVQTFKKAGLKGVVLTCKHHDGFCLWPTKYTDYCIRNTPYKDGKGDIVGELSAACKKYGLKFGVYLSPWDRHQAFYGTPFYVEYFYSQLLELLTKYGDIFEIWFDGANGGDGWYGGAKEKRTIDRRTYYDFPRAYKMLDELQPHAIIFSDGGPGCRWVGNEKGYAFATNWSFLRKGEVYAGYPNHWELQSGHADGDQWVPAECDVSIRPGWFYHDSENNKVKSVDQLTDLYYRSVGHNANLILNMPVDKEGLIYKTDSINLIGMHKRIVSELSNNLLKKASIKVSSSRGKAFSAKTLTDDDYDTYWATADNVLTGDITIRFKQPTKVNRMKIMEYIPLGQRVKKFSVEYKVGSQWLPVKMKEETTTVGYQRLLRFKTIESKELRIRFLDSRACLTISEIGAYYAPNAKESYEVKESEIKGLDYTKVSPSEGDVVTLDLGKPQMVSSLYYKPAATGIVSHYKIYAGEDLGHLKEVSSGEFSNIRNNPILQEVFFTPTRARYVQLKAVGFINDDHQVRYEKLAVK